METIIIVCLLILIALQLHGKIIFKRNSNPKSTPNNKALKIPDIMGQTKIQRGLQIPNDSSNSLNKISEKQTAKFDSEIIKEEIGSSELKEKFDERILNRVEEEEELRSYGFLESDSGFALGVTFEELGTVGRLLKVEKLNPAQKEAAVAIVQKIQGTDLFSLLESSMENASQKIAALLDSNLSVNNGQDSLKQNDVNDFNIREFI